MRLGREFGWCQSGVPCIWCVEAEGADGTWDDVAVDVEGKKVEEGIAISLGDKHIIVVGQRAREDDVEVDRA